MPRIHWAWIILADGFYVYLVMYGIRLGYGVILPSMSEALHLTSFEAGMIASSFFPSYVVFALILGFLTDMKGSRVVVTLFSIPMAAGAFLMVFVNNVTSGVLCQVLIGVGAGIGFVPVSALIQRWFSEKRRGFALGVSQAAPNAGLAVMAAALPILVGISGWQGGWLLLGLLGSSLIFSNWFLIRDSPESLGLKPWGELDVVESPKRRMVLSLFLIREIAHDKCFWFVGLSYLCMAYAIYVPLTFLVTYATQSGMSYANAGLLTVTFSLVGIPGSLFIGHVSDRVGRRVTIVISQIIMAFSLAGFAFGGPSFIFSSIFGLSYGGIFALYAACAVDYFPREVAGSILGLWTLFYGVAGTLSPVVSGYVAGISGGFAPSFLLASLAAIFSAVLIVPAGAIIRLR